MESSSTNPAAFNADKVAQIKQAISEGRFQVNSAMVADRLIANVRELIDGKA
jgi:negative regulator of flagellin synthesis FlgM